MSNEIQILQTLLSNFNESPDLPTAPRKSAEIQSLEIKGGTPQMKAAHAAVRCHHVKTNGIRCGSPALREDIYCYFHRNWRTQPDCQPRRPDPNGILYNLPVLEDADGIQMALQLVLDSVLSNNMDLKRAGILLYGLQTAAANVRRTDFDSYKVQRESSTELK